MTVRPVLNEEGQALADRLRRAHRVLDRAGVKRPADYPALASRMELFEKDPAAFARVDDRMKAELWELDEELSKHVESAKLGDMAREMMKEMTGEDA